MRPPPAGPLLAGGPCPPRRPAAVDLRVARVSDALLGNIASEEGRIAPARVPAPYSFPVQTGPARWKQSLQVKQRGCFLLLWPLPCKRNNRLEKPTTPKGSLR